MYITSHAFVIKVEFICNKSFLPFQDLTLSNIFKDPPNIKDLSLNCIILSKIKVPPLYACLFVHNFILQGQSRER